MSISWTQKRKKYLEERKWGKRMNYSYTVRSNAATNTGNAPIMKYNSVSYGTAESIFRMAPREESIYNYNTPGLIKNYLKYPIEDDGKAQVFTMTRPQEVEMIPQNNERDFTITVMNGTINFFSYDTAIAERSAASHAAFRYNANKNSLNMSEPIFLKSNINEKQYGMGNVFIISYDQFYRIRFSAGAVAMMFEGEIRSPYKRYLFPVEDGMVLNTFHWHDWMNKGTP